MRLRVIKDWKMKISSLGIGLLIVSGLWGGTEGSPRRDVSKGINLYHQQEYEKALSEFISALEKDPSRPEIAYDVGTALYKLERYPQAAEVLKQLSSGQNKELSARAYYNLGNALINTGDIESAIQAYKQSLKLDPHDKDAKHNLELALRLKQMKMTSSSPQNKEEKNAHEQENSSQEKERANNRDQQQFQPENQMTTSADSLPQPQPNRERKGGMSKEEARRLLQAIDQEEQEAQKEKLQRELGEPRQAEKDW